MKRIILLINFLTLTIFAQEQEKINYQLNGKNIEFNVSQEEFYVEFTKHQKPSLQRISKDRIEELSKNSAIVKMPDLKGTFEERKQSLKNENFQRLEPVLIYDDGTRQIAKGELYIKLKENASLEDLLKDRNFTSQVNEFDEKLYLVKLDLETYKLFELINQLHKDIRVEFIEPNFTRIMKLHTSDPFFSSQWAINNQGYLGGTLDADMDVDNAWSYSTGSGIKVAVIDEGVDLSHPDLSANLLSGYDATGNGSNGSPNLGNHDAHGTACAGIIAAVANNSKGIAGVAYNAKIIPVRVGYSNGLPIGDIYRMWITNDNWIANGIDWAWQNGADVLSNSYGGGSYSRTIANSINNAVNNGRNGKGSIVLFSSGNDLGGNGNPVSFPATVSSAISVGASSMCDTRKNLSSCDGESWGSNFGSSLDIVAPGVKIYTTDISGSNGYVNGNYISSFNGTSSACPNAAGVVALMLSINPNLTQLRAREILEKNVDKISGYNYTVTSGQPNGIWNDEVGYGRVNALKAVKASVLDDIDRICSNTNTVINLANSQNHSVAWQVSSNVHKISSNNNSITIRSKYATGPGSGWVKATFNGNQYTENFGVNKHEDEVNMNLSVSLSDNYLTVTINDGSGNTPYQVYLNDVYKLSTYSRTVSFPYYQSSGRVEVRNQNSCGTGLNYAYYTGYFGGYSYYNYKIFPNPTSNILNIQSNEESLNSNSINTRAKNNKKESSYELYDFNQNLVSKGRIRERNKINLSKFKKGHYILLINTDGHYESHRVIIN